MQELEAKLAATEAATARSKEPLPAEVEYKYLLCVVSLDTPELLNERLASFVCLVSLFLFLVPWSSCSKHSTCPGTKGVMSLIIKETTGRGS